MTSHDNTLFSPNIRRDIENTKDNENPSFEFEESKHVDLPRSNDN